ncbi:MAG: hypothetical protein ACYC9Y_04290 [Candidatus Methylomirabilia bacterium]
MNSRKARYSGFVICLAVLLGFSWSAQGIDLPGKEDLGGAVIKTRPRGFPVKSLPADRPAGAAPASVSAVSVNPEKVLVSWEAAAGASEYTVWSGASATVVNRTIGTVAAAGPRRLEAGQAPNSTVYYRVSADYPAQNPGVSAVVSAKTPPVGKNPTATWSAETQVRGEARLMWNHVPNAISYNLQGPGVSPVSGMPPNVPGTSYLVKKLPVGTHTWVVFAVFKGDTGELYFGDESRPGRISIILKQAPESALEGVTGTTEINSGNITPCGGAGQRACCALERDFGACSTGLVQVAGCTGNCTCGGINPLGIKSSGTCAAAMSELSFEMSVPAGAKFRVVVPGVKGRMSDPSVETTVSLKFARKDPGLFCSKIKTLYADLGGSNSALPSNPAVDDWKYRYSFSTPLCNFDFQDNHVDIQIDSNGIPANEDIINDVLRCVSLDPADRRQSRTQLFPKGVAFQVYTQRPDGTYQLKAPAQCDQTPPHYCYLPVEVVCEAIPLTP